MNYWLIKSEPSKYSWQQFLKDKRTYWDGVRNFAARNNLREMKKGDEVFFYHSNEGMEIAGIATVVRESYQDPTSENKNWVVVDVSPAKTLKRPVTLAEIKTNPKLKSMELVRNSRLSVQKVTAPEWNLILEMAGEK